MDDQLHLLTGAYALNAVDDDERRRFEHDLPFGHPTAEEARELSETAALLASLTTPVAPPAALRERLLAQIATLPQVEPRLEPGIPPRPDAAPLDTTTPAPEPTTSDRDLPTPITRIDVPRRRRLPAGSRWLAAVAAVAVLAMGGTALWALEAQQQRDEARQQLATLEGSPAALMNQILSAPDAAVQKAGVPGGGSLLIVHSRTSALGGVMTIGMPEVGQDKTYELWLIDAAGAAKPAGLVPSGVRTTWNSLAGGVGNAAYLGVTIEPAGGTPQPTTKPIVLQALT